jgi:hypothetical protein
MRLVSNRLRPHPQSIGGPFYVVDGCCTACGVPESAAPDLFSYDAEQHCFVKRQPGSADEIARMLAAVRGAELDCIRYRGSDPDIIERFAELGVPGLCDRGPKVDAEVMLRKQVSFAKPSEGGATAEDMCSSFCEYVLDDAGIRARPITIEGDWASFEFAWVEDQFHFVRFRRLLDGQWLAQHYGNVGVSDWLQEWLVHIGGTDVRWYRGSDATRAQGWRATPW